MHITIIIYSLHGPSIFNVGLLDRGTTKRHDDPESLSKREMEEHFINPKLRVSYLMGDGCVLTTPTQQK